MNLTRRIGTILAITVILATVLVVVVRSSQINSDLSNNVSNELINRSSIIYAALDPIEDLTMALLRGVSDLPQVRNVVVGEATREEANAALAAIHTGLDFLYDDVRLYASILIADADMNIVASAHPTVLENISNHQNQENIRQARMGNEHISDITISTVTGLPQSWYTYPIMDGNSFLGMVIIPVNSLGLNIFLQQDNYTDFDYYVLVADRQGSIYFASHPEYLGRNVNEIGIGAIPERTMFSYTSLISGLNVHAIAVYDESTGGLIISFVDIASLPSVIAAIFITLLPTVLALVAGAMFIYLSIRNAIKPLKLIVEWMHLAALGIIRWTDEEKVIVDKFRVRRDEIGDLAESYVELVNYMEEVCGELQQIAAGELDFDIIIRNEEDAISKSMHQAITNLHNMFGEINSASSQVSSGSQQIANGALMLAQGSTEQAATVQELSAYVHEISEKTKANAEMAGKAAVLAKTIKGSAEKGNRQMDDMVAAVNEISQASQSINKVIKVIDDIAFQTNILALNAAVEAARAGQHGKGFAVVADEVRSLAAKSAEAAKDTGALISNSMEKAEHGARIAKDTAESLVEIVVGINESNEIISEIASASEAQTVGIAQINSGIDQVTLVVQQNSATSEESAAAAEELSGQSAMLESLIARFKLKDSGSRFGNSITAANPANLQSKPGATSFSLNDSTGKY